jgi:hypothetical protein
MNDLNERAVTRALDPYSQALHGMRPSSGLDARVDAAIKAWSDESAARRFLRRPLPWAVAVASIAIITGGIALLVARDGKELHGAEVLSAGTDPAQLHGAGVQPALQLRGTGVSALAAGQVSLWPAESAIFRVKASLASTGSAVPPGGNTEGERQYWVDVRIANDGTMRIMQVIPADRGRVVPFE